MKTKITHAIARRFNAAVCEEGFKTDRNNFYKNNWRAPIK